MFPFLNSIPPEDQRNYRIDAVAGSYYGLYVGFMAPFIPVLLKRLEAAPVELGLCLAAPFLTLVITFPFLRFLSGFRALDIITVPTFFSRACIIAVGFLHSPTPILLVYLFSQFMESLGIAPYARILREIYSDRGRSLAMGYVRALIGVFLILGSVLGGAMIDQGFAWLVFLFSGVCGSISSANFWRVLPRDKSPRFDAESMSIGDVRETLRVSEGFWWLSVTVMFFGFGNIVVIGVLPTLLVDRFQISNAALGNLTSLTYIANAFSYILLGKYITKYGAKNGLLLGLTAGVMSPWLILLAPSVPYLAIPYSFNGIMYSAFDMSWMILLISYVRADQVSRFAAVYTLMMGIRGIAGTLFVNLALPYVPAGDFLVLGGLATVIGLAIGIWKRKRW